eukprot:6085944-Pleurochrysis_carterae.AAC.2
MSKWIVALSIDNSTFNDHIVNLDGSRSSTFQWFRLALSVCENAQSKRISYHFNLSLQLCIVHALALYCKATANAVLLLRQPGLWGQGRLLVEGATTGMRPSCYRHFHTSIILPHRSWCSLTKAAVLIADSDGRKSAHDCQSRIESVLNGRRCAGRAAPQVDARSHATQSARAAAVEPAQ